jgi:hypothetical protein
MINNFKQLQQEDEQRVPPELEQHILAQASHVRMMVNVAGIFGSQAARAAVRVLGGWHDIGPSDINNPENTYTDTQRWRLPPDSKP